MCFSAAASFTVAGALYAVGAATLAQRPERKRLAFAFIPVIFAAHQTLEGFIWLALGKDFAPPQALIGAYLFLAQIFWPVFTPLSVLLMENEPRRRLALWILLAAGLTVSIILLIILLGHQYTVSIVNGSVRYATDHEFEKQLLGAYLVATTAPLLVSRHRYVIAFGAAVLAGSIVTQIAFYTTGASVWCFFAAIASVLVFMHVRRQARLARA